MRIHHQAQRQISIFQEWVPGSVTSLLENFGPFKERRVAQVTALTVTNCTSRYCASGLWLVQQHVRSSAQAMVAVALGCSCSDTASSFCFALHLINKSTLQRAETQPSFLWPLLSRNKVISHRVQEPMQFLTCHGRYCVGRYTAGDSPNTGRASIPAQEACCAP